jgi:hypothetical protein
MAHVEECLPSRALSSNPNTTPKKTPKFCWRWWLGIEWVGTRRKSPFSHYSPKLSSLLCNSREKWLGIKAFAPEDYFLWEQSFILFFVGQIRCKYTYKPVDYIHSLNSWAMCIRHCVKLHKNLIEWTLSLCELVDRKTYNRYAHI